METCGIIWIKSRSNRLFNSSTNSGILILTFTFLKIWKAGEYTIGDKIKM